MQNHVLVKKCNHEPIINHVPVQQFEQWLYQQVLLMQKSYGH